MICARLRNDASSPLDEFNQFASPIVLSVFFPMRPEFVFIEEMLLCFVSRVPLLVWCVFLRPRTGIAN